MLGLYPLLAVSAQILSDIREAFVVQLRVFVKLFPDTGDFFRLGVFFRFGQLTNAVFDYGVGYIPKFHVTVRFDDIFLRSVAFGLYGIF